MTYFHFSLGPVQEFVNQARRTSDFWAGSFLLSWLAGVAMCAVQRQGGKLEFPLPPNGYLGWIEGINPPADGAAMARIGAIPNRFSAIIVNADFDGQIVTDCVREAWIALARHTLEKDGLMLTEAGKAIWKRQIELTDGGLWDMHWVLLDENEFANAFSNSGSQHHHTLDMRKHWRSHYPDKEPGRKCSLMHGWQELSGASYNQVEAFWEAQRADYDERHKYERKFLDINKKEHLCAPAYVKRRFVQHFASFTLKTSQFGQSLRGWKLPLNVPSTQYLAAAPWIAKVLNNASTPRITALENAALIQAFEAAAQTSGVGRGEKHTDLRHVKQAALAYAPNANCLPELHTYDGVAFFEDEIRSQTYTATDPDQPADALHDTAPLITALKCLQGQHGSAAKYYALLLMDGDRIGDILDRHPKALAKALQAFTDKVAPIVQAHSGFVVYAGGDDVLALLPMDEALPCALALRQCYLACFAPHPAIQHPSISAAIEFADFKTPLTQITSDAHELLDKIAKHKHGRDSLAVRVWKGSGIHLTWCQPWATALGGSENTLVLATVLAQFQAKPKLFSSGFFFRANDVYRATRGIGDAKAVKELIMYEYGHSLVAKRHGTTKDEIEALLEPLYRQSIPHKHDPDVKPPKIMAAPDPQADFALLVRFLWQKGFEGSNNEDHTGDPA